MASKQEQQAQSAIGWPEGLVTGAVGGFLFGGPVGLALGIGQGILAKRLHQSELDKAYRDQEILSALDEQHAQAMQAAQGVAATDMDKQQATQMDRDFKSLRTMATSLDPETKQRAIQGLAEFGPTQAAYLEDVETRNEKRFDENVGMMDTAATDMRDRFTKGLGIAQTSQATAEQAHRLLSDPNFDVNAPLNRARLVQLLGSTPRELFADPASYSDALRELGEGIPLVSNYFAYKAGTMEADEFKFTKEQWRNVFHAVNVTSKNQTDQVTKDAATFGMKLDQTAQGMGHTPAISYLDRIVTGKVQEGPAVSGAPGGYGGAGHTPGASGEPGSGGGLAPGGGPGSAPGKTSRADIEATVNQVLDVVKDPAGAANRAGQQTRQQAFDWWQSFKDEQAKRAAEFEASKADRVPLTTPLSKRKRRTN